MNEYPPTVSLNAADGLIVGVRRCGQALESSLSTDMVALIGIMIRAVFERFPCSMMVA